MSPEEIAEQRRRAAAGDPEATAFTAVLAGVGVGEPQSWDEALARLERAARLGSAAAADQLSIIGDLRAWLQPPERTRLCHAPRATSVAGFLSPAARAWMIGRARGRTVRAKVFDTATGQAAASQARGNSAFEFAPADLDVVTLLVRARMAATVDIPVGALEATQVLHYATGESFAPHFDFLDPQIPGLAAEAEARGQRIATVLIYLNDDFEGGETDFPRAGVRFKGAAGDALLFANVDPPGRPEPLSLHAGLAPTRGEKWILSQWIRDRVPY